MADEAQVSQTSCPPQDIDFSPGQDAAYSPPGNFYSKILLLNYHAIANGILDFQHSFSQYGNPDSIFDDSIILSFRHKHRFLDEIYNSCSDTDLFSAKSLDSISRRQVIQLFRYGDRLLTRDLCRAGLSMEEVLAWFGNEKERRTRLFAHISDLQPGYQFPLSPARTITPRQNATITLSTSQYTSPRTLSQIDEVFSPGGLTLGMNPLMLTH